MAYFRNPVGGPRVVPFGTARTSADVLRNGHPGFRVTQRYGDWDAFFKTRIHGGTDMGNYYCAENVYAMAAGTVWLFSDSAGAKVVEIAHANGYKTQYWHLAKYRKGLASGQQVVKGYRIGIHGSTGLDIGGCHLHIGMKDATGRPIDPWPYMNQ